MPMPLTTTTESHPISQSNFVSSLNTAMQNAGFVLHDSHVSSGAEIRVYREVFDSTKTFGSAFVETSINTGRTLSFRFGTSYNTTTKVLSNSTISNTTFTAATNANLAYSSINGGSEFRCVFIRQGTSSAVIFQMRPSLNKPNWWDEDVYPYWWACRSIASSPFGNIANPGMNTLSPWGTGWAEIAPRNVQGQTPGGDIILVSAVLLQGRNNPVIGPCGVFSNDLVQTDGVGKVAGVDKIIVTAGVEEYLILESQSGGLAVRIV